MPSTPFSVPIHHRPRCCLAPPSSSLRAARCSPLSPDLLWATTAPPYLPLPCPKLPIAATIPPPETCIVGSRRRCHLTSFQQRLLPPRCCCPLHHLPCRRPPSHASHAAIHVLPIPTTFPTTAAIFLPSSLLPSSLSQEAHDSIT